MSPLTLSRLAFALSKCQSSELTISALSQIVRAAMEHLSQTSDTSLVIADLHGVYRAVHESTHHAQLEDFDSTVREFLIKFTEYSNARASSSLGSSSNSSWSRAQLVAMSMTELKGLLVQNNLPSGGNKTDLIERLLGPASDANLTPCVSDSEYSDADKLKRMTVAQLKEHLASQGLRVSGRKQDLIDRLLSHRSSVSSDPEIDYVREPLNNQLETPSPPAIHTMALDNVADDGGNESRLTAMTVAELKILLRDSGLKVGGKKSELVERCIANGIKP